MSNPQDPQFSASVRSLAAILLLEHGLVPAHLFPGETERDINVGHAGQQPLV
jgi:hypothetical protein